jgi:hypothetical protein
MKVFSLSQCSEPRAWEELKDSEKFYIAQALGGSRGYNRVLEFMNSLKPTSDSDMMKANMDFIRARFREFEKDVQEVIG